MERLSASEYLRVSWKARYVIVVMAILAGVIAGIVGSMQPKIYAATSTMLAPRDAQPSGMSGTLGSLLSSATGGRDGGGGGISFPGFEVSMPRTASNLDVFNTLLTSRSMREDVVSEFAKQRGPEAGGMIRGITTAQTKDRTALSVTAHATDPKLAADVANAYFDFLDRRLQRQADNHSRRQEVFYRSQLERAAREVDVAEEALVKFQRDNRMVASVDVTAKAGAEASGNLRGAIMAMELQREILRMRYTEQHPQMREADKQINELKKQYSKNLFGQAMDLPPESPGAKAPRKEFFVSTERMTPTQFAYLKLLRNLKIQEAFYTGAFQGLENMRYATEAGKPPSIEILDPAIIPSTPISPNIRFIVFAAVVAAIVTGVIGALVREYVVELLKVQRRASGPTRSGAPRARPAVTNGTAKPEPSVPSVAKPEAIV